MQLQDVTLIVVDATGPSQNRGQRRRRGGRSVASSSTMTQDDTTHGLHAVTHFNIAPDIAGPSPKRSRRADVIKEEASLTYGVNNTVNLQACNMKIMFE